MNNDSMNAPLKGALLKCLNHRHTQTSKLEKVETIEPKYLEKDSKNYKSMDHCEKQYLALLEKLSFYLGRNFMKG